MLHVLIELGFGVDLLIQKASGKKCLCSVQKTYSKKKV
jgi:hypothetical protein